MTTKKQTLCKASLAVILSYLTACCAGCLSFVKSEVVYQDDLVKIYQKISPLPHGTDEESLELNGQTFHNLYSYRYRRIEQWNSILFTTHRDGGDYYIHIYDLGTKKDTVIRTEESFHTRPTNAAEWAGLSWQLVSVTDEKLVFTTKTNFGDKRELKCEIDRSKKEFRKIGQWWP